MKKTLSALLITGAMLALSGCIAAPMSAAPAPVVETPDATVPSNEATPTTAAPEPEPVAEEGTRDNPFPAGTTIEGGDWTGIVGATNLDANAIVAEANMFNEPPADGQVYIAIPVEATYVGTDEANSMEITVEYVTSSGEVIDTSTNSTFVAADDSNPYQDLFEGGTVSFTEYLLVPSEGAADGLVRVTFGWINGAEGFVTLS